MTEQLPRLLVVDDEKDNLDAIKRLLRKDFEIHAVSSGAEALELVDKSPLFDVILSDQRMPGMTGSEFLEKVQNRDSVATRVLLTGFSDLEAVIDAINRGHIWRYIPKPWEPEDLRQALKQAAERTRLRRSLDESRRELERTLTELRARDWSRERLLQILLHEFRTAPQILEGLRGLDPGGADGPARLRFIESLEKRFGAIENDISTLMAEEKRISQLPKEPLRISEILKTIDPSASHLLDGDEPLILVHKSSLADALKHLRGLLEQNSAQETVKISIDVSPGPKPDLFVIFSLSSNQSLVPTALAQQKLEPRLAWPLLLEPFVGAQNFEHHSTGLRIESARVVRLLAAMGGRAEFQVSANGTKVELLVVFKSA